MIFGANNVSVAVIDANHDYDYVMGEALKALQIFPKLRLAVT